MQIRSKMRSRMMRFGLSLAPIFLWAASAHAAPRSVYFWNSAAGTQGARAGVETARVGVWGNGEQRIARDVKYEDADTLRITTRNLREGVRFDLRTPLDVQPYLETGYVRLRVRFREVPGAVAIPGTPATPGIPGVPDIPGMATGETDPGVEEGDELDTEGGFVQPNFQIAPLPPLGGMPGMVMPGMEGMEGFPVVPAGPIPQETPITQLLCTFVLDDGVMEGMIEVPKMQNQPRQVDLDKVRPDANGWLLFTMPVKQMQSTPNASGLLHRVILSGNRQDSFWLTQIALVAETGEMQVSIRQASDAPGTQIAEITVRPGPITLVADVEAGAADPAVEWNFDADNVGNLPLIVPAAVPGAMPGMDPDMVPGGMEMPGAVAVPAGPRIDARGLVAKFEYPNEEQNYRVEVTVRDRAGKKEPVTSSILVQVRS